MLEAWVYSKKQEVWRNFRMIDLKAFLHFQWRNLKKAQDRIEKKNAGVASIWSGLRFFFVWKNKLYFVVGNGKKNFIFCQLCVILLARLPKCVGTKHFFTNTKISSVFKLFFSPKQNVNQYLLSNTAFLYQIFSLFFFAQFAKKDYIPSFSGTTFR